MTPRQEAKERGDKTYEGKPCNWCGGTTRWVLDGNCIHRSRFDHPGYERNQRYKQSPKGREKSRRSRQSPKGRERHQRFAQSPNGREMNRRDSLAYYYRKKQNAINHDTRATS